MRIFRQENFHKFAAKQKVLFYIYIFGISLLVYNQPSRGFANAQSLVRHFLISPWACSLVASRLFVISRVGWRRRTCRHSILETIHYKVVSNTNHQTWIIQYDTGSMYTTPDICCFSHNKILNKLIIVRFHKSTLDWTTERAFLSCEINWRREKSKNCFSSISNQHMSKGDIRKPLTKWSVDNCCKFVTRVQSVCMGPYPNSSFTIYMILSW